jgi:hypothetical protein
LEAADIQVAAEREVIVQRLHQGVPGQLGKLSRRMAEAGVNIEVLYSDHDHQLILVVDDPVKGRTVAQAWMHEQIGIASEMGAIVEANDTEGLATKNHKKAQKI